MGSRFEVGIKIDDKIQHQKSLKMTKDRAYIELHVYLQSFGHHIDLHAYSPLFGCDDIDLDAYSSRSGIIVAFNSDNMRVVPHDWHDSIINYKWHLRVCYAFLFGC